MENERFGLVFAKTGSINSGTACGRKNFFFLDIKKFLYTHEKDEFNDVNTPIFEKMY